MGDCLNYVQNLIRTLDDEEFRPEVFAQLLQAQMLAIIADKVTILADAFMDDDDEEE